MSNVDHAAPSTEDLPFPQHPPDADDWLNFRPFILHLYQTKQQTARVVVQELKVRGFNATEKMLRDRLKQWNVRKNASGRRNENVCARAAAVDEFDGSGDRNSGDEEDQLQRAISGAGDEGML